MDQIKIVYVQKKNVTGANMFPGYITQLIPHTHLRHMYAHMHTLRVTGANTSRETDKHRAYAPSTMISDLPGSQHSAK